MWVCTHALRAQRGPWTPRAGVPEVASTGNWVRYNVFKRKCSRRIGWTGGLSLSAIKPFFKEAPALSLLRCKSWYSCDVRKRRQSRGVQKPLVVSGNYTFSVAATLPSSWFSKRPWLKRSKEKGNETGHSISTSGLWICSPTPPMHAHMCAHTQAHTEVSKITLQSGCLSLSEEMVDRQHGIVDTQLN